MPRPITERVPSLGCATALFSVNVLQNGVSMALGAGVVAAVMATVAVWRSAVSTRPNQVYAPNGQFGRLISLFHFFTGHIHFFRP